jgi:hypothetical protein
VRGFGLELQEVVMFELDFEAEPFDLDGELAADVIAALVQTGIRDVGRLTNTAFFLRHPERDFAKKIDPTSEKALADEWKQLQATLVMPALGAAPKSVIASSTTLLVGDSHSSGAFGKELERLLESGGAKVERHAEVGSAVKTWLPRMAALLETHRPSTVIVALGANMREGYADAGVTSHVRKMVRAIRAGAPAARIIWIGAPRRKPDSEATLQAFNTLVRAGLDANVTFVDSAPHTPVYRGGDKDHYYEKEAKAWARGVYEQLR